MAADRPGGRSKRRAIFGACAGVALTAAAIASDFVVDTFWAKHAMLTSLLASLLVVVISVLVINELIERRDRRRWTPLAQSVLFALLQSARLTWTTLVDVLGVTEARTGSVELLLEGARIAIDTKLVSAATHKLLADPDRRALLQRAVQRISDHASEVIANWATVMVGSAPYANVLNRHVELQGRLEWLSAVLAHNEPAPDGDVRSRRLNLASVATEHAEEFDDGWVHDMVVSITALAARLDYDSRELAFSLASTDWWTERTRDLAAS